MNTLTKDELATQLAESMGLPSSQAHQAVSNILGIVQKAICAGRRVELRGLGCFIPGIRAARVGRNPGDLDNKPIQIPAKNTVRFKLSTTLKKELNKVPVAAPAAPPPTEAPAGAV